jgi:hypothetical protein
VKFDEYIRRFTHSAGGAILTTVAELDEPGGPYPLLRLDTPGPRRMLLTAGFHGEEPAGPLTVLEHLAEILSYAQSKSVALTIYPCINPSGFEDGTRYNRSGEKPNNDFMRYRVSGGTWKGELAPDEPFETWKLSEGGPKETQAVRADVAALPPFVAGLDVHQDRWVQSPHVYAYVQQDRTDYLPLIEASGKILPPMREAKLDELYSTDAHGLTYGPDGSITDYSARRGARWAATLETTTISPMADCHRVNMVWIKGFIDLAART